MTKGKYIISIMGPTGVGKTELAIELSKLLNSFLISVDSVQVYKGLNIGSGKRDWNDWLCFDELDDEGVSKCHRLRARLRRESPSISVLYQPQTHRGLVVGP